MRVYTNNKKRINHCFLAIIGIMLFYGSVFGQTAEDYLVGYWKFDEGAGTIAADSSGNGYNGAITGAAWFNDTIMGNVLNFEGADYITIPSAVFSTINSQITISLWQYGDVVLQPQNDSIFYASDASNKRILNSHLPYGTGTVYWDAGSPYDRMTKSAAADEYEGQWNHWVFTKNASSGIMEIYCNGELWAIQTGKTAPITGITQFKIGSGANGTNNYDGMICKFRIYDVALSDEEISDLYATECSDSDVMPEATEPIPGDGERDVSLTATLSWTPDSLADAVGGSDLYFGTSYDAVEARDSSVHIGIFGTNFYTPGILNDNTTYYWVVDTVNNSYPDSPWQGDVWKFTTMDTHLLGYWKLKDGLGTIAKDDSVYGNDGGITGAAWVSSEMGYVLDFEGNDYVTIPNNALSALSNKVTVTLWQYGADIQPQRDSLFFGVNNSGDRILNVHLPWSDGDIVFDAGSAGTYDRMEAASDSVEQYKGQWNHWAFVKDCPAGQMKIYCNGSLWQSVTGKTKPLTGMSMFKIGANTDGSNNYDGMICEFRVYDRILTDSEISNIYTVDLANMNSLGKAKEPTPEDKDWNINLQTTLRWTCGIEPVPFGQDVYIGTDYQAVFARNASVYAGTVSDNSYNVSLKLYKKYYWAVDIIDNKGKVWVGDVWSFKTRNVLTQTEGYYNDVFFDGGKSIAAYESLAATRLLGLSAEFVKDPTIDGYDGAHYLMSEIHLGDWDDDNGVLLYPDGDARFRVMYVGGGTSTTHDDSLMAPDGSGRVDAQERVRQFYANGGSYCGSCAGAALSFDYLGASDRAKDFFRLFDNFRGDFTNIGGSSTDYEIPDGVKERKGYVLPKSPLLKYYDFGGDYYINSVRQNGGNWCKWYSTDSRKQWPWDKAEVLTVYNDKIDGVVVRAGYKTTDGASSWAYKRDEESGRICPCGGHPEGVSSGEKRELQASLFAYAIDGGGCPVVKAALTNNVTRLMNDNSVEGYERIGDRQYHHFTIEVSEGSPALKIDLAGEMYDLNLYAKYGDFAFKGEPDVIEAVNNTGSNETLTIQNPMPGTWYIGVKCNTIPTRTKLSGYYKYTGNLEVLNGIAYEITAKCEPADGDANFDGTVDGKDLKIMAENWMADNGHIRHEGELIGQWDFAEGTGSLAMDISGNNNTATLYGNAAWVSGAIGLDGEGDYLQTSDNSDKLQLAGDYSISIKINAASSQVDWAGIITKCSSGVGITNHWSLGFGSGATSGKIIMFNAMTIWDTGITLAQVANGWHKVAVVYGSGFISSYLDGQQVKNAAFATLPLSGEGHLNIGCDRRMISCYDGQIDDLQIFDYELTSKEVHQLHQNGIISMQDQLVGHWKFEGNLQDNSGNGRDGTLKGSAVIINDTERGKVISLDGTNSYVSIPNFTYTDATTHNCTLSFWFNAEQETRYLPYLFSHGPMFNQNNFDIYMRQADDSSSPGAITTRIQTKSGTSSGDRLQKTASGRYDDGEWHMYVATKSENTLSVYIDGQLDLTGSIPTPDGPISPALGYNIFLGAKRSTDAGNPMERFFNGMLDDVRIYSYALSADDIINIYNGLESEVEDFICVVRPDGDLNGDCKVDFRDFTTLADNWLK